jgi:hypothetical protein
MELLEPDLFVALGAEEGDSYCAFCQAVDELQLRTRCHAVHSWQGEPHRGSCGPDVLEELSAYHDPIYGHFSTLLRSTFDDALETFSDRSIDLLHINGSPAYEAVRHDFETWLPKMSERGVVLLHRSATRESGYGVWKLWKELAKRYPGFELPHGHGLGVLAVGEKTPAQASSLFSANKQTRQRLSQFFLALGQNVVSGQAIAELRAEASAAEDKAAAGDETIERLKRALGDHEGELAAREAEIAALRGKVSAIKASTSWKITGPMRAVKAAFPRSIDAVQKPARLLYWALTFQLPGRLRTRRTARKIAASGLFDGAFYLLNNPDVAEAGVDPLSHYVERGAAERRNPNPLFDTAYYLAQAPEAAQGGANPLLHYIEKGAAEARDPSPHFDTSLYLEHNPQAAEAGVNPLSHYFEHSGTGRAEAWRQGEDDRDADIAALAELDLDDRTAYEFDPEFYRALHNDLHDLEDGFTALLHYKSKGEREERCGSPGLFLQRLGVDPGTIPLDFDWQDYLTLNPDLERTLERNKFRALEHYLLHGKDEGRPYKLSELNIARKSNLFVPIDESAVSRTLAADKKIACLVHIYYADLWPELSSYISNFGELAFDLYVNIVETRRTESLEARILADFPEARILVSKNEGRDIGGFVKLLGTLDFGDYDVFCLLHTKKSPHLSAAASERWRRNLLDALLKEKERALENAAILRSDETVGLIGSANWRNTDLYDNSDDYYRLLDQLGITEEHRNCEYLAGTMMFVRASVLAELYSVLKDARFEDNEGKDLTFHLDGQLAHAVERVIGNIVRHQGYRFFWQDH